MRSRRSFAALLCSGALASCGFGSSGGKLGFDPAIRNAAGTITVSDPKLYPREALIEERRDDVAWINRLIKESEDPAKIKFEPQIARELEQVTSFAAALGLSFDPAPGTQYRRNEETGSIQQEIDVLRLQLELEQLKRDAELFREKLATQSELSNDSLGSVGSGEAGDTDNITASAANQLKAAIDSLNTSLAAAMTAEGKLPARANFTTNPLDDFRDRTAYRNLLKAARNAAVLDDLHEYRGARLYRLNFQSMALPERENTRSLGVIEMKVRPPRDEELNSFYEGWFLYINKVAFNSDASESDVKAAHDLVNSGRFLTLQLQDGTFIFPKIGDSFDEYDVIRALAGIHPQRYRELVSGLGNVAEVENIAARDSQMISICAPRSLSSEEIQLGRRAISSASPLIEIINLLSNYPIIEEIISNSDAKISSSLGIDNEWIVNDPLSRLYYNIQNAREFKNALLSLPESAGKQACLSRYEVTSRGFKYSKTLFDDQRFIRSRVYEIGPREQVQQVSTVARSANSLALAVSILASAPAAGSSANAAASYSRQAVKRAAALERVPNVVGYAVTGRQQTGENRDAALSTFGWVLGPKANLDLKGGIEMGHSLQTYDLSVDLSVPRWWPSLELDVVTGWAPSPLALARGDVQLPNVQPIRISVPLPQDDRQKLYEAFTDSILNDEREPEIEGAYGGPINACAPSTIILRGDRLWRTTQVLVLDKLIDESGISILPDMDGIIVKVPKIDPLPYFANDKTPEILVMTRTGTARHKGTIRYEPSPAGAACKPGQASAQVTPSDPNAPQFTSINGGSALGARRIPALLTFDIVGEKLGAIDSVRLDGVKGDIVDKTLDGKLLKVEFPKDKTGQLTAKRDAKLVFYIGAKEAKTYTLELVV